MATRNYTLGRGELHFAKFPGDGTQVARDFRYIGNTPDLSFTAASDSLDHFSSDHGIKQKDDSVAISATRTGAFTTDDIDPENVAMFFFGGASLITQASAASQTETLVVKAGYGYFLGVTAANPVGLKGLTAFTALKGGTALVQGTDYNVNLDSGLISFIQGGAVTDGSSIACTYSLGARTMSRVVSGEKPIEGALRFIADNPKGRNIDYMMPWVKVTPNGDMNMKGDNWQSIPFNLEILKIATLPAVYADGRPYAA